MSRVLSLIAPVLPLPAVALAQGGGEAARPRDATAAAYDMWRGQIRNIVAAAEELSEADYGNRPVATVRTIGDQAGVDRARPSVSRWRRSTRREHPVSR